VPDVEQALGERGAGHTIAPVDFDKLRTDLIEMLQPLLNEFNATEVQFSPRQSDALLTSVTQTFILPIRLLVYPYGGISQPSTVVEKRKVSRPVPLEQCVELQTVLREGQEFPLPPDFQAETMPLAELRHVVNEYTDRTIEMINQRYDVIDVQLARAVAVASQ
jgi:hypothetical protein